MSSLWLVLFTSRILHNGTCCVGFDWSYVSAKVAWAIGSSESKKKSACPARPQELDDDADDIPIVHSDRSTVSEEEDEDNKPLVQPSSGRKQLKRESSATHRVPTPLGQKTSRGRSEDVSSMGKHSDGEALKKIINTLSDVSNLKDLHLKHYHTSSAQFKKRTTHLDIPRKVYDLYQHVVKTCPFCNSTKPRPDRSRVSGLRTEEFGRSHLLGSWFCTSWRPNIWISDCFGWCYFACNGMSMLEYLPIRSHFQASRVDGHFSDESEGYWCRHGLPSSSWHASVLSNAQY